MATKSSSKRWLKEHFTDFYVKAAQEQGYRSRAIYKLVELQERDQLFKKGMVVVDLGAAPGGWSQYVAEKVGESGKVIALDLLPMLPLARVTFIQGDFNDEKVIQDLNLTLGFRKVDWVISDMAPNMSGNEAIDIPCMLNLAEEVLSLAKEILNPKGGLLIKVFQGEGFETYLAALKRSFKKIKVRKPKASRDRSKEIYLLGRELRLP